MENKPAFTLDARTRLYVSIILFMFAMLAPNGLLPFIQTYYPKLIATCTLIFMFGFIGGYQPARKDPKERINFIFSRVLGIIPFSVFAATQIAGLYSVPSEQRDAALLKPVFLMPFLLIFLMYIIGIRFSQILFKKLHPDLAFLTFEPEEPAELIGNTK